MSGKVPRGSQPRVKEVVSLSAEDVVSDKTWKCVGGRCRVRFTPILTKYTPHWKDSSDFAEIEGIKNGTACKHECLREKKCTGFAQSYRSECILWFRGACNIDTDNGHVWTHVDRTCQLRSVVSVEGFWKPVNAIIGE